MKRFEVPEFIEKRLTLASAAASLSSREYALACILAGLETHAAHDELLSMAFKLLP